jgi:hypothetical protein
LRKAILRRLVLVRSQFSTEWTLRLRGSTVAWRRGVTRYYWVSLLLWWPTNRLECETNVGSLRIKYFQESRSGWQECSSCLILSKTWLLGWLLAILVRRLLAVGWLTVLRLAIDIWLLLERRCTRHGPAPRHATRTVLPDDVRRRSRLQELGRKLTGSDGFRAG